MTTRVKTWTQIEGEIAETFRKWHCDPPTISCRLPKRSATKRFQTREERAVTIEFRLRTGTARLTMSREERAIDNLEKIAQAVEWLRMADVRQITTLIMPLLRQLYPAPAQPPPPPRASVPPHGPYAVLHVASDAPLAVCEAAYRALAKAAHPDQGGDTAAMQRLNAAIERIRSERGRGLA